MTNGETWGVGFVLSDRQLFEALFSCFGFVLVVVSAVAVVAAIRQHFKG